MPTSRCQSAHPRSPSASAHNAAMPATCAAAMLVPSRLAYVSGGAVEYTSTPGARRSTGAPAGTRHRACGKCRHCEPVVDRADCENRLGVRRLHHDARTVVTRGRDDETAGIERPASGRFERRDGEASNVPRDIAITWQPSKRPIHAGNDVGDRRSAAIVEDPSHGTPRHCTRCRSGDGGDPRTPPDPGAVRAVTDRVLHGASGGERLRRGDACRKIPMRQVDACIKNGDSNAAPGPSAYRTLDHVGGLQSPGRNQGRSHRGVSRPAFDSPRYRLRA